MTSTEALRALPRGFSLVEVVLALGIVSYAILSTMALFPMASSTFQDSRAAASGARIIQQIVGDYSRSDLGTVYTFATSGNATAGTPPGPAGANTTVGASFLIENRYYDAEGTLIGQVRYDGTPETVTLDEKASPAYSAAVSVAVPWMLSASKGSTSMVVLQIRLTSRGGSGKAIREYSTLLANQAELPASLGCYSN